MSRTFVLFSSITTSCRPSGLLTGGPTLSCLLYNFYLLYNLYCDIGMKSSGIVRARRRPTAPHPEKEEGSRRLAGWVRHEGGRLRADRGPASRSGRERRGGAGSSGPWASPRAAGY